MNDKPKAVFLDSGTVDKGDIDWSPLKELFRLELYDYTRPGEVCPRAQDAEVIICNKTKVRSEHLSKLEQLKYIIVAATGYDNIDTKEAARRDIPVSNIEGYSTPSVVQLVYALLLAYLNRAESYFEQNRNGAWSDQPYFSYWDHGIEELSGKTMGILGLGTIGQGVARVALAFGMEVLATHKHPDRDAMEGVTFVSFEELLERSDILSLHAPLNESTRKIINAEHLMMMSPDAVLINTARGGLIDEKDLKSALEDNIIEAALLDVLSTEPPPADHPLLSVSNCYITPHQAWAGRQSRQRLMAGVLECARSFMEGDVINRVN